MDSLGVYVHIPFCIQRCHYCDFATYAKDQIAPNDDYVDRLCQEIESRKNLFDEVSLKTIYFGGGTPSLLSPMQIKKIIDQFKKSGFSFLEDIEITLEVNPATLDEEKCLGFLAAGVNRLSLGCQSFNDDYLRACNREHNAQDTRNTITLIKKYFTNYSLDLLFSLPQQGLEHLEQDLKEICAFSPPHVSAYCLTLPERHPMNEGRCSDDEQISMFHSIISSFQEMGLQRYELSNFSKVGFESRHNNLYWTDHNFWGVGLSAHSYKKEPGWGHRFWNPSSYKVYMEQVESLSPQSSLEKSFPESQREALQKHESLTDFCHTFLRMTAGLEMKSLRQKFGPGAEPLVMSQLKPFIQSGLVQSKQGRVSLTDQGFLLSNLIFKELIFSSADVDKPQTRLIL